MSISREFDFSRINKNYCLEGASGNISCSQGNIGGISYGIYQFASNVGVPQSFVGWLNKKGHTYGRMLSKFAAGSREFSCCWQYIGEHDPHEFKRLQDEFVETNYFLPTLEHLEKEFGLSIGGEGFGRLKDIIWVMAVEFGPRKTIELMRSMQSLKLLPAKLVSQVEETELIEHIRDILATDEWVEVKKQFNSGLCSPIIGKEYGRSGRLNQNSA